MIGLHDRSKTSQELEAELNSVLDELDQDDVQIVAFDIETNSVVEKTARVIGVGVSYEIGTGIYIPFAEYDPKTGKLIDLMPRDFEQSFVEALCEILMKKYLIMHNGVFDIAVMYHSYGINLTDALWADTLLMKHTVSEERPFGLKELANLYKEHIGFTEEEAANQEQMDLKDSVVKNGGRWVKDEKEIFKGDLDLIGKYCCADCDLTLKIYNYLSDILKDENLEDFYYNQEVMPLYKKATIQMKIGGVFVDVEYFNKLEKELEDDILKLSDEIFKMIEDDARPLVEKILDEKVKETRTGKFAEGALRYYEIPIPTNKRTGKPTLAKSALQSLQTTYPDSPALEWLLSSPEQEASSFIPRKDLFNIKKQIFVAAHPELPYVFNLSSNDHLSKLLFDHYGETPKSYSRKTGKPQVNKNSLESWDHLPFISKLLRLKKNQKLLSTYIKPILNNNVNGWIYPPMKQFGTTAGRYSCGSDRESTDTVAKEVNLQTLPRFERPKRCTNDECESKNAKIYNSSLAYITIDCPDCGHKEVTMDHAMIKRGFIAPPGYKIVNADFSSLEPRIFSWVSGDYELKRVWLEGLDLYSKIAIDVFQLDGVSANEKDPNYLKKVKPDERQKSKVFTLAVPYGANAWRIAEIAKVEVEEAQEWISRYLESYPDLQNYMRDRENEAMYRGYVQTKFGRIRHLDQARELFQRYGKILFSKKKMVAKYGEEFGGKTYYEFRNLLNNAKNFPIQSTAAHVCNAALIELSEKMDENQIDGWIALQVHDEITCIVREEQAELVAELLKESMEDNFITREIDIPITAEPLIARNLADAK